MHEALRELHAAGRIDDADAEELGAYLDMAAHQLVNTG
jgi:truncated hemoglobin YjbI